MGFTSSFAKVIRREENESGFIRVPNKITEEKRDQLKDSQNSAADIKNNKIMKCSVLS